MNDKEARKVYNKSQWMREKASKYAQQVLFPLIQGVYVNPTFGF